MDDHVAQTFRVAVTADAFDADGKPRFAEMGLELLEQTPGVEYRPLAEYRPVLEARQLEGLQGLLVLDGGVDAATLSRNEEFLALSRFGVGYDQIDVAACTDADVVLLIAAGAVDRSMAEALRSDRRSRLHRCRRRAADCRRRGGPFDGGSDHRLDDRHHPPHVDQGPHGATG